MRHALRSPALLLGMALALSAPAATAGQHSKPLGPHMPFVDGAVCPFEGCTYGEWTSSDAVKVRRERDRRSAVVFEIAAGQKITAVTGAVVILRAGRVEFTSSSQLQSKDGVLRVNAGDTLYLLSYTGAGFTNAWLGGRVFHGVDGAAAFFDERCADQAARCSGKVVEPPLTEWWVQVRSTDGRTGWTDEPEKFDGKSRIGV